jgi:hypothetical protein
MRVADAEARAVGVKADHVDLARDVDGRLEAIGLRDQERGRVTAITRAVHAKLVGIRHTDLDEPVRRGGHPLDPRLTGPADDEVHGRVEHRVAVVGEERGAAVETVVEERLVNLEDRRILLALLVADRIAPTSASTSSRSTGWHR